MQIQKGIPGDASAEGEIVSMTWACFFFFHAWQVPKAVVKDFLEYHLLLQLGSVGQILHVRVVLVFIPNMAGLGVIRGGTGL